MKLKRAIIGQMGRQKGNESNAIVMNSKFITIIRRSLVIKSLSLNL